ncbi:hypothetical protein LDENG_00275330 [Lucifuga dentata]|nr:hypothetical protein LDENG_00275330 [Lucifuga dentata]
MSTTNEERGRPSTTFDTEKKKASSHSRSDRGLRDIFPKRVQISVSDDLVISSFPSTVEIRLNYREQKIYTGFPWITAGLSKSELGPHHPDHLETT